jgi:hypothetical protein
MNKIYALLAGVASAITAFAPNVGKTTTTDPAPHWDSPESKQAGNPQTIKVAAAATKQIGAHAGQPVKPGAWQEAFKDKGNFVESVFREHKRQQAPTVHPPSSVHQQHNQHSPKPPKPKP